MGILEEIAARKTAGVSTPQKPKTEIDMRGSGITQKFGAKAQAQINREEKASMGNAAAKAEAEAELHKAVDADALQMQKDFTKGIDIVFDESQESALDGMLSNQFWVLIGPAGSGKTTLEREFFARLLRRVKLTEIAGAAFTGRATQQMRRALPPELHGSVSTIHSLLEYAPTEEDYDFVDPITGKMTSGVRKVFRPRRNATNKLTQKVFIFDEAGMIGISLWNEFIDACPHDAIIGLIGDIHQLPPVMDKSVLGFAMNVWPVFELKKIHRQAAGNAIIDNAHNVLQGKSLENAPNFHLMGGAKAPTSGSAMQVDAVKWLHKLSTMKNKKGEFLFDPLRDAFIVPYNKGFIGQKELNPHLLMLFNPPREVNGIIVNKRIDIHTGTDRSALAVGDKMMVTSNINTIVPPITNGMIGIIEEINLNGKYDQKRSQFVAQSDEDVDLGNLDSDNFQEVLDEIDEEEDEGGKANSRDQRQASHVTTIKFENGQTLSCSTAGDYRRITHSYAITCHKAQGGEYPNVVILVHSACAKLLYQEWLYTAITRARENVYIFYNNRGLKLALERQKIKGNTLQEKIKAYNIEAGIDKVLPSNMPILWKPEKIEMEELEAAQ